MPQTEWFSDRNLLSHSPEGETSETKASAGLVSPEGREGLSVAHLSRLLPVRWQSGVSWPVTADPDPGLHPHSVFSLCAHLCPRSPFCNTASPLGLVSAVVALFYLDYLSKDPVSK